MVVFSSALMVSALVRSAGCILTCPRMLSVPGSRQLARRARHVVCVSDNGWPAQRVREKFIKYFEEKHQHTMVPSSPVVPLDDPTLLFANAGMNQFKPLFVGQAQPGTSLDGLKRATNSQKCIRAGGKHNDLEDVGMDTYHHTFFEMLGSWSFGDYFKEEAIDWAWDLFTNVYGLPAERFYATYFEGDEQLGLAADEEARQLWLRYLPPERILPGNAKDNFWEMGDTGPCGPCSEIHFDRIGGRDASGLVNMDDPDVLEVWNLVFMQFNRENSGSLRPLPAKSVDTGMGFERLVSILQDKRSNYDTDVFTPIFAEIHHLTGGEPYGGRLGFEDVGRRDTAFRVVADHIRTLTCAIADGAVPSNEGRGYVLRRILRRGVRYGRQMLGAKEGFFAALVPSVVSSLGEIFPELVAQQERVQKIIANEEAAFSSMLSRGIKEFNVRAEAIKATGGTGFDGSSAFFLYDSMGFPLDLTELMAREAGLEVDALGFEEAMAAQKARSAAAAKAAKGGDLGLSLGPEQTAGLADRGVAFTDDKLKFVPGAKLRSTLRAIYGPDGFMDETDVTVGSVVGLVLDRTTFFSEAGGQVADIGMLVGEEGAEFDVTSVESFGGYVLHQGVVTSGVLRTGEQLECRVDYPRRAQISVSHTLTHVMNLALHQVLGEGVSQKGSLVDQTKARFDFSHDKAMSIDELQRVEELVQASSQSALPVHIETVPLDKALQINNLRAVFGERYPDPVRVVSIGPTIPELLEQPDNPEWEHFSIELCGGTHIAATDVMLDFALVEETSVAKGVRRVVGITGDAATNALQTGAALSERLAQISSGAPPADALELETSRKALARLKLDIDAAVISAHLKARVREQLGARDKELVKISKQLLQKQTDAAAAAATEVACEAAAAGKRFVVLEIDARGGLDAKTLPPLVQSVVKSTGISVLALLADTKVSKVACCVAVPDDDMAILPANTWLQAVLKEVDGRGGGKPSAAQGSGSAIKGLPLALERARTFASEAFDVPVK
mmetsp:Transcript_14872/g.24817  ORF Transcript_14872/g.24817 Transcript_14872/m.24817 type:complete len:1012 (+) Transcript_14872:16-3051(+)